MKNLKKKSLSLVLAGLTLAGLAMTVDVADVSSKSEKLVLCIRFLLPHGKEKNISS